LDIRLLSHVEVDVGVIARRWRTHAIERRDPDLDAAHARLIEEEG